MKKLVFMFVAVVAISFASCGNKTSDAAATDSVAADTTATVEVVDTTAAPVDTVAPDTVK